MKVVRLSSAAALAALLAACSHVPVETAWKLRNFDPLTADPSAIRAAVVSPAIYVPREGGAKMVITQARKDGRDEIRSEFVLEDVPVAREPDLARIKVARGSVVHAYRIAERDIPPLLMMRQMAAERAAKEPGAFAGTFTVAADGCRLGGVELPEEVRVSTWIKTEQTGGFIPLIDELDLVRAVGREKLLEASPACPAK